MAKQPKAPFSNIRKPSDSDIHSMARGVPFGKCPNCGRPKISTEKYCVECKRLVEEGFGVTPRASHPQVVDTQERQSYDAFNRSGYSGLIPRKPVDPNRERY